jgi:hypothetical protein
LDAFFAGTAFVILALALAAALIGSHQGLPLSPQC